MTTITAAQARKDIYNLIHKVNESSTPITITAKGKSAVLVGEDDWSAIQETLYLTSIPNMPSVLLEGKNTSLDDCISEEELEK